MEKAYLFDVVSKLYISTDSGPVDMQSVELCSDMIDVVLDVSGIYGLGAKTGNNGKALASSSAPNDPASDTTGAYEQGQFDGEEGEGPAGPSTLLSQSPAEDLEGMVDADSTYDSESASVIRLSNGMVRINAPH